MSDCDHGAEVYSTQEKKSWPVLTSESKLFLCQSSIYTKKQSLDLKAWTASQKINLVIQYNIEYKKCKSVHFTAANEEPSTISTSPTPPYVEKIIKLQELKSVVKKIPTPKVRCRTPQRCFLVEESKKKRPNTAVSFRDTKVKNERIDATKRPTTSTSHVSDFNWDNVTRCQSSVPFESRSYKSISRPNTALWYNPLETEKESYKMKVLIKRQRQIEKVRPPASGRPSTAKTLATLDSKTIISRPSSGFCGLRYLDVDGELTRVPSFSLAGSFAPVLQEKVVQIWNSPQVEVADNGSLIESISLADGGVVPGTANNSEETQSVKDSSLPTTVEHPASIIIRKQLKFTAAKYLGNLKYHYAALKIQTYWRMYYNVQKRLEWIKCRDCARKVWNAWQQRKKRIERRRDYQKRLEEAQTNLQKQSDKFSIKWKTITGTDRIIVKLNSASFSKTYRCSMENQDKYENEYFSRLEMQRILNINFNFKELIESKRLILVELPKIQVFPENLSLGSLLLSMPESLAWIKFSISGMPAYIESSGVSDEECFLSQYLKIPVLGSNKASELLTCKRQNQRKFAESCKCEIPPGVELFRWEMAYISDIVEKFEQLLSTHPQVKTWIFKMNETTDCFGLATFTRNNEIELINDLLSNLRLLKDHRWQSPKAYLHLFIRHGGIIEAKVPVEYDSTEHPYFYFQILPDFTIASLGSCNMIPIKEFGFCGMFTPCNVNNTDSLLEKAMNIAKEFASRKYTGIVAVEFIQWFDPNLQKHTTWVKSIKPYYTEELGHVQYTRLITRCSNFRDEKLVHVPSPDEEPEFKHLKKLKHFEMNKLRKKARMAQIFDRSAIFLWGLQNDMIASLSFKSFECLCIENDIIMGLNYCGTFLPDMMHDELTADFKMLVVDQSLEHVVERLFKNFVLLCRTLHHETTHNFLDYCQIIYNSLKGQLPQFDKTPLPYHLNDLELFVYQKMGAWGLFTDTKEDREQVQPVQMLSTAAIQLLNLDIPSSELQLDPFYGKIAPIKPHISKTKIQPGTTNADEYLEIMSSLAELGIQSDAKTNRRSKLANHIKGELRDNEKAWKLLKLCASRGLMDQNIADKLSSTILDLLENNSSDTANLLYLLSKMIPILPLETFPAILGTLLKIFKQLNLNIENIRKYGMVTCVLLEDLVLLLRSNIVRTIIEKPENAEIFSRLISLYSKAIIATHNQPGSESTVIHGGIDNGTTSILSPELLQIFSMLKYTCQIQSIIKLAKPLDLKKILFIFKFLFASIDDLEEFEPEENMSEVEADQESQYDKEKLAEICRPSLLTSVVEYTLQIFKLGSCVLNIKDFAVWIKVIQLIQEPEYNARYSEVSKLDKLKASILKLLAYAWTDFLKGDENELLCINKALIPCLVSPCGKIIENYFSQKASISEFNSALVLVSKFMLFKLYKNTAIDNGILEYLAHSSHIDQSLKKENLAYVKFLEEISHDSSIRFKLTTSSQDRNILHFMAGLATEAMKTLYHKGQEHLQDLLGDILAFLNQYFGHDPIICDLFCSEDDSILGQLINLLSNVIVDMLSLDLQDTTTSLSSQNIRHVSHFIDSLLRFEKPQVYILSQGLITSLAKIMLNINHSDVPEIFSKIIGRILTDPNLTLRFAIKSLSTDHVIITGISQIRNRCGDGMEMCAISWICVQQTDG
ncbi:hypothetical protein HK103_003516 [Boothiomyces macroporosus]|uniref:IQCH-like ATP-grasp domain-containing protein n=1 Tax=Boothiomyces macroporosus TaxID=261099 RepID=A0AAD5Y4L2_9FUNG|nr:hypothetical protein HK103_003516 [Boothiomyces macroporosus]